MNKLKENYQFVIGFVAIIISLSAFKDELKAIKINLSFISFDASDLFFWLIIGYLIVLQIYIVPFIFSWKFPESKFLKFLGDTSYTIFIVLSLSPIIIGVVYLFDLLISLIPPISDNIKEVASIVITLIIGVVSGWISRIIVQWFKKGKTKELVEKLEEKEVKELETTNKLSKDGYYAQSILELSKTIETRLYKTIISHGVDIKRRNLLDLLRASKKIGILSDNDISSLDELRVLRNKVVHESDLIVTKEDSVRLLELVKGLINKLNNIENVIDTNPSPFFKGKVFDNLASAKLESEKLNKPIFMVIFDGNHPKKSRIDWALGYFMEYDTTKKLVSDNFIQVIVDCTKENVRKYIPEDKPLETCLLVILNKDDIIRQETVYANMDEGMKRVRESIKKIKATNNV